MSAVQEFHVREGGHVLAKIAGYTLKPTVRKISKLRRRNQSSLNIAVRQNEGLYSGGNRSGVK